MYHKSTQGALFHNLDSFGKFFMFGINFVGLFIIKFLTQENVFCSFVRSAGDFRVIFDLFSTIFTPFLLKVFFISISFSSVIFNLTIFSTYFSSSKSLLNKVFIFFLRIISQEVHAGKSQIAGIIFSSKSSLISFFISLIFFLEIFTLSLCEIQSIIFGLKLLLNQFQLILNAQ